MLNGSRPENYVPDNHSCHLAGRRNVPLVKRCSGASGGTELYLPQLLWCQRQHRTLFTAVALVPAAAPNFIYRKLTKRSLGCKACFCSFVRHCLRGGAGHKAGSAKPPPITLLAGNGVHPSGWLITDGEPAERCQPRAVAHRVFALDEGHLPGKDAKQVIKETAF